MAVYLGSQLIDMQSGISMISTALPTQEKTAQQPTETPQYIEPTDGYTLSKVTVPGVSPTFIGSAVNVQNFFADHGEPSNDLGADGDLYFDLGEA